MEYNNATHDKVNIVIVNEPKIDSNSSLSNGNIKYTQLVLSFDVKKGKKECVEYYSGLRCLFDSGASDSTTK